MASVVVSDAGNYAMEAITVDNPVTSFKSLLYFEVGHSIRR